MSLGDSSLTQSNILQQNLETAYNKVRQKTI